MNINFNKIIISLIPLFIILSLAIIIARITYTYLPKYGVEHIADTNKNIKFTNYNYINSFGLNKTKVQNKTKKAQTKEYVLDKNILLKAIYLLNENDGFVVVQERSNNKSKTLAKNEFFKDYKLIKIKVDHVIFEKNNKHYKLSMNNIKKLAKNTYIQKVIEDKPNIVNKGDDNYALKKNDLLSYGKDLKKIWNDIGIRSHKTNGKISGFKIYKLRTNSVFSDLGLKRNDILIKANNLPLNSYQNAFDLYKQIDKMELMQLTILRNNREMEINYEIE